MARPANMVQMKHPKAKIEFPEQVRTRVEEARRKLKKPSGTLVEPDDDCENEPEPATTPPVAVVSPVFPEFPELNLTILKGVIRDQARIQPYTPAPLMQSIAIA